MEGKPELAERVYTFAARFARTQDKAGDKLIPKLGRQMLEAPGSVFGNLNRMETLRLLSTVAGWVEARNFRNLLVQGYMQDRDEFAGALYRSHKLVSFPVQIYNGLTEYVRAPFEPTANDWPSAIREKLL